MVGPQAFEDATLRVKAEPNDFRDNMGQERLSVLYVIDAMCINNMKHKSAVQIPDDAYQQVVKLLGSHLPTVVGRLAIPCNCDQVSHQIGSC
jgi:hypothetical protein